jgi:hypothetical protein
MPLQATSGAASYDAFGGGVPVVPTYIEDVMSTWLYTGTGATQTITNGIDLSTKGGLVWTKNRTYAGTSNTLYDTLRGVNKGLESNTTGAQVTGTNELTAFNTNGFTVGSSSTTNWNTYPYVSWTFRKQPKFFDVVTYTGNGASNRSISHALGATPGFFVVKPVSTSGSWFVYHRSAGSNGAYPNYLVLNSTDAAYAGDAAVWPSAPTSSVINIGSDGAVNASGGTYVAYIFAHDAGGFGLTGTDNVISCGSFTGTGGAVEVNVGFEPQWIMFKSATAADNWRINDVMRGIPTGGADANLAADLSNAEYGTDNRVDVTATGFIANGANSQSTVTHIYIAIRRGPMKVPTSGTSVFSPNTANASAGTAIVTNFPVDLSISVATNGDTRYFSDRLRGVNSTGYTANQPWIASNSTGAELTNASIPRGWDNTQILLPPYYAGGPTVWWNFKRAPSFFDEVCYTGTGVNRTIAHNLTVAPELVIIKSRSNAVDWVVGNTSLGFANFLMLNRTDASGSTSSIFNNTAPTSSVFSVGTSSGTNEVTLTYVAYLFATCAGVSKVGSYTGTATTKQIDCGFTGGARFVLIKRTDSTGDWYVWDTARGIVSGNDSYLLLNSTAAEVTNTDYIDTYSAGFEISSTAPAAINASGGSFIFFAVA